MGYFCTCDICGTANDCRIKDGKMLCGDCEIEWDNEFGDQDDE